VTGAYTDYLDGSYTSDLGSVVAVYLSESIGLVFIGAEQDLFNGFEIALSYDTVFTSVASSTSFQAEYTISVLQFTNSVNSG